MAFDTITAFQFEVGLLHLFQQRGIVPGRSRVNP
jgi:hypothetical protein